MSLKLRVQNFRSWKDFSIELPDKISIITGPNGAGKTSLMEAVYIAETGKSWRSNFDEILHREASEVTDWWRIDYRLNDEPLRTIKYNHGEKSFTVDDKTYKRMPKSAKRPVVLFEPGDMQILYGSPTRRRQFLDRYIAELEPRHQTELNKFTRVLRQRNNLLKQDDYSLDELTVWNIQFCSLSINITKRRRQYLKEINNMLLEKYREIASLTDSVNIRFIAGGPSDEAELMQRVQPAQAYPNPSIGAQRDDYKFIFRRNEAKTSASRGENRTILFAVLGAMTDLARAKTSQRVLVLLDDIDSELDRSRRVGLYGLSSFKKDTIATTLEFSGGEEQFNLRLDADWLLVDFD